MRNEELKKEVRRGSYIPLYLCIFVLKMNRGILFQLFSNELLQLIATQISAKNSSALVNNDGVGNAGDVEHLGCFALPTLQVAHLRPGNA